MKTCGFCPTFCQNEHCIVYEENMENQLSIEIYCLERQLEEVTFECLRLEQENEDKDRQLKEMKEVLQRLLENYKEE